MIVSSTTLDNVRFLKYFFFKYFYLQNNCKTTMRTSIYLSIEEETSSSRYVRSVIFCIYTTFMWSLKVEIVKGALCFVNEINKLTSRFVTYLLLYKIIIMPIPIKPCQFTYITLLVKIHIPVYDIYKHVISLNWMS